jgi:hypothetical protein
MGPLFARRCARLRSLPSLPRSPEFQVVVRDDPRRSRISGNFAACERLVPIPTSTEGRADRHLQLMLYSLTGNIAFAHYPKTAGSAIAEWFRRSFPDARYVRSGHPHVDVRRSLAWLSGGRSLPPLERLRYLARASNWRLPDRPVPDLPSRIRVVGVVRPPLEMLGSLAAYWRRSAVNPNPADRLVTAAWEGRSVEFVRLALGGRLPSYATFFDVGGPAWSNTRLIQFDDVEAGLQRACDDFGLGVRVDLPRKNCRPDATGNEISAADIDASLRAAVERHFAWYPAACAAAAPAALKAA